MKNCTTHSSPANNPAQSKPEVATAEVLAWVSDCLEGGLCLIANGLLIFENAHFGEPVEAAVVLRNRPSRDETGIRAHLFAVGWNRSECLLVVYMLVTYRIRECVT